MNIQTESQKAPEQLEREVNERRAHMSDTLHALEERLSPAHIVDQVLTYARRNGGEFSQNLVETVKQNPVPTMLTAVGLAWLLYGQSHPERSGHLSSSHSTDASASFGTNMSQTLSDAKHQLSDTSERIRQRAQQTKAQLRHQSRDIQQGFDRMLTEQPLVIGALGIALGALIGGVLPSTAQEDRVLGATRDRLADQATSATREVAQKADKLADKFNQGLNTEQQHRPSYQ